MTIRGFVHEIYTVVASSAICGIPTVRRLTASAINLRIPVTGEQFIDVFFNEETGRTAYALIKDEKRLFGADDTGGWHVHPFADPDHHAALKEPMTFVEFVKLIEIQLQNKPA